MFHLLYRWPLTIAFFRYGKHSVRLRSGEGHYPSTELEGVQSGIVKFSCCQNCWHADRCLLVSAGAQAQKCRPQQQNSSWSSCKIFGHRRTSGNISKWKKWLESDLNDSTESVCECVGKTRRGRESRVVWINRQKNSQKCMVFVLLTVKM